MNGPRKPGVYMCDDQVVRVTQHNKDFILTGWIGDAHSGTPNSAGCRISVKDWRRLTPYVQPTEN